VTEDSINQALVRASKLNLEGEPSKAAVVYEQLVERNSGYAAVQLGYMHNVGRGVALDKLRAEHLYSKAKALGEPLGQYYLGLLYLDTGRFELGFEEISSAAKSGYLPAINRLGDLYLSGIGCAKNMDHAAHYKNFAADKGHLYAMRWKAWQNAKSFNPLKFAHGLFSFIFLSLKIFKFALKAPADPRVQA
jgi:TPR repeat protein